MMLMIYWSHRKNVCSLSTKKKHVGALSTKKRVWTKT